MTEQVQVALIVAGSNVLAVVLSRLWSHKEHRQTAGVVDEIHRIVSNGKALEEEKRNHPL